MTELLIVPMEKFHKGPNKTMESRWKHTIPLKVQYVTFASRELIFTPMYQPDCSSNNVDCRLELERKFTLLQQRERGEGERRERTRVSLQSAIKVIWLFWADKHLTQLA